MLITTLLPPEWHRQSALMLTWPHPQSDWHKTLPSTEPVFLNMLAEVSRYQNVLLVVHDDSLERLNKLIATHKLDSSRIIIANANSNDTWTRDFGPISVLQQQQPLILDFQFNGWGGKYPADKDNTINQQIKHWQAPLQSQSLILEGGSIEVDGNGTLLTTEACLLDANRNPGFTRSDYEQFFQQYFGIQQTLWLSYGALQGDDTDSHIDNLARFAPDNTIIYASCNNPTDTHYHDLQAMAEQLHGFSNIHGQAYTLIDLPLPDAIYADDGRRLPASYINFIITNQQILMPAFNQASDTVARQRLQQCFTDKTVIAIDSLAIIEQNGGLHCLSMQLPENVI